MAPALAALLASSFLLSLPHCFDFIDSFLPFPQPISDAFWMLPVQRVLLCDSADQYPALPRGKCFSDILQAHLH